MEHYSQYVGIS